MIVHENLSLTTLPPRGPACPGASLDARGGHYVLSVRRPLPGAGGERWALELELTLPELDPDHLLRRCEGFLVDASDGRQLGVVEHVETDDDGRVSALVVATGWFGRRHLRVDPGAVVRLVPAEQLLVADAPE
jgi:hypothetical protein